MDRNQLLRRAVFHKRRWTDSWLTQWSFRTCPTFFFPFFPVLKPGVFFRGKVSGEPVFGEESFRPFMVFMKRGLGEVLSTMYVFILLNPSSFQKGATSIKWVLTWISQQPKKIYLKLPSTTIRNPCRDEDESSVGMLTKQQQAHLGGRCKMEGGRGRIANKVWILEGGAGRNQ